MNVCQGDLLYDSDHEITTITHLKLASVANYSYYS